jgi:protein SCO1
MSRTQKILTTALWALLVVIMVSVIGAGWWKRDAHQEARGHVEMDAAAKPGEVLYTVPAFDLIDQNNQPVTDQSLRGKPWIAAFIFTRCAGPCPMMSANMRKLQERVPHADLRLVSFTVDPERDTPEVLKGYVGSFDPSFVALCGTPEQAAATAKAFKGFFAKAPGKTPGSYTVDPTANTYLFDTQGRVRLVERYGSGVEALAADVKALLAAG